MNLEDWQLVKRLIDSARVNYLESEKFLARVEAHADRHIAELREVRPILTRNPYTGEVSESAWEASDAYSDDVWRASGV